MASTWVIALGLAAGYLMNKNLAPTSKGNRLEQAQQQFNDAAQKADPGPESEEIRSIQRTVPAADLNESLNIQDLSRADVQAIQASRQKAAGDVVRYEAPLSLPEIEGVYLHFDNHGV